MGDDIGLGLFSMVVCFDLRSTNVVQLSYQSPNFYPFRCHHTLITQLRQAQNKDDKDEIMITLSALFSNHAFVPSNIKRFQDGTAFNTPSIESKGMIGWVLKNIVKAPL